MLHSEPDNMVWAMGRGVGVVPAAVVVGLAASLLGAAALCSTIAYF